MLPRILKLYSESSTKTNVISDDVSDLYVKCVCSNCTCNVCQYNVLQRTDLPGNCAYENKMRSGSPVHLQSTRLCKYAHFPSKLAGTSRPSTGGCAVE